MELIIKILFILSMFVFNISMLSLLYKMTDDAIQKTMFIVLCGFNVLTTTIMLAILHPLMLDNTALLVFSGFVGGAIIFVASVWIAITIE